MKKKTLLKNPWILTLILIIISFVLGILVSVLFGPETSLNAAVTMIAALIVGRIYGKTFKEIMPKNLKIKVSLYFVLFQLILGSVFLTNIIELNLILIGMAVVILFIVFWIVYFMLGVGSRTFVK